MFRVSGKVRLLVGLAGVACVLLLTASCLVVRQSSTRTSGDAVVKGKLEALEEGATTREDIIRAFGAPDQTLRLEDGREILVYVYEREQDVDLNILFLLRWEADEERTVRFNFELKDGVLVRYWKEDVS